MKTAPRRPTPSENDPDSQQVIRKRAYELYEFRGKEEGHDLDDWLQAESELKQARASRAAA